MADNRTEQEKARDFKESLENDRLASRMAQPVRKPSRTARRDKR